MQTLLVTRKGFLFGQEKHTELTKLLPTLFLGESFRSLSFQFRIGERTISAIVEETCEALYITMKDHFLKV